MELVAYFHRKADHADQKPTVKELTQAKAILADYNFPTARKIVDFAIAQGRETNFHMKYFGAILAYVGDAVAEIVASKEKHRLYLEQKECERQEARQREAEQKIAATLSQEELYKRRINDSIRYEQKKRGRELTHEELSLLHEQLARMMKMSPLRRDRDDTPSQYIQ